jgi:hypothetical protein
MRESDRLAWLRESGLGRSQDSPGCAAALLVASFCFGYHRLNEQKDVGSNFQFL